MNDYIKNIAKVNKKERFNAIIEVLENNNIKYEIQSVSPLNSLGNIIVTFNKNNNTKKIVVSAHYDNEYNTPGANDNATSCSILLNLILDNINTTKYIEFVFFDLEETRENYGSKQYIKENNSNNIDLAINLDMCGQGSNIVISTTNFTNNLNSNLLPIINNHQCITLSKLPQGDANNFINAGIPTLYVINSTNHDLDYFANYSRTNNIQTLFGSDFLKTMHQPTDTYDLINLNQVEKIYKFVKDVIDNC